MEPATAAAAYAAETVVEGAIGAAVAIARPTMPIRAAWRKISAEVKVARSGHSACMVMNRMHVFGGRDGNGKLVNNTDYMQVLSPSYSEGNLREQLVVHNPKGTNGFGAPRPRLGHTATNIGYSMYIFGGNAGSNVEPLQENGRVWAYDSRLYHWTALDPPKGSPIPPSRSYHACASVAHPTQTSRSEPCCDLDPDAEYNMQPGTMFIYGGRLANGKANDVWSFDIMSKTWSQLADASRSSIIGQALSFSQNRLYCFGGTDEKQPVSFFNTLEFTASISNAADGQSVTTIAPRTGEWEPLKTLGDGPSLFGAHVQGSHVMTTGQGRRYLLLFLSANLGNKEDSPKIQNEIWSLQLESESKTAAKLKDTARAYVGAKDYEYRWARVDVPEDSKDQSPNSQPPPSDDFASAYGGDLDADSIFTWGGISVDGSTFGDGWALRLE